MTKHYPDPFDTFPEDGTPLQFLEYAQRALDWIKPYLDNNDMDHQLLQSYFKSYSRLMSLDADHAPKDEVSLRAWWQDVIMKQRLIVSVFHKARNAIIAKDALAQANEQSKSQSERASKPRKLDDAKHERIAKAYWALMEGGRAARGGVKELAGRYEISTEMVRKIAKKYPPD